ncbi:MAG: rhodanese-like domain-containing protein [Neisseria sp.]|jgi:phage shock operon rhodanese pspE|uniref:rhodanese-like domain-containing protein n=1 Tax=unclassified Neisseria TaxID=2623750 RepID=UPI00031DE565|nr:rhodanese-like domain-containing protein [Neisseria sp. oral taxon 014]RKV73045.1 MAG: rhodanese-like domain-containing protein [Neisseria sp.]
MRKLLTVVCLAAAFAVPVAAQAAAAKPAEKTAAQPAKAKGIWIDVRTPEEFKEGHLKDAVNIPVDQIGARIGSVSPDKSAPVNLYCRSGRRSEAALQELKKMGYTNVTNHGGYQDLLQKGLK